MSIVLITGSAGLIGSEAVRFFSAKGFHCVGIDNDMRKVFFGDEASTDWNRKKLEEEIPQYTHTTEDIRNFEVLQNIFKKYGKDIVLVIHTAAQPSHDWAVKDPIADFTINANGTLNLLEATRLYAPKAVFIFTSTNKVYGDRPNRLPLVEKETRWELNPDHPYAEHGIPETMSIDENLHSIFGASKVAADVMAQEYGRYFGMKVGIFRGGCVTGPNHSGTKLHGFLSYLVKCAIEKTPYQIYGYKGKQVRDNIHSFDLVNMFWHFFQKPHEGEVYNVGGSRFANCSILEAMALTEKISGLKMQAHYIDTPRLGDHIWWVSDLRKFQSHYPEWQCLYRLEETLQQIIERFQ
jgi:CDP-paratose 2-epimerase